MVEVDLSLGAQYSLDECGGSVLRARWGPPLNGSGKWIPENPHEGSSLPKGFCLGCSCETSWPGIVSYVGATSTGTPTVVLATTIWSKLARKENCPM